jgi:hypothetical protein
MQLVPGITRLYLSAEENRILMKMKMDKKEGTIT